MTIAEKLFIQIVVLANGIFASYLVEIDMAKIALSCHFALDLLCYDQSACDSHDAILGTGVHGVAFFCGTIAILATS